VERRIRATYARVLIENKLQTTAYEFGSELGR